MALLCYEKGLLNDYAVLLYVNQEKRRQFQ